MLATSAPSSCQDLGELSDAQVQERFEQVHAQIEALQTQRLVLLASLEHRKIHARDGHLSITAWLLTRFALGWGRAKELVSAARALEQMPQTRRG